MNRRVVAPITLFVLTLAAVGAVTAQAQSSQSRWANVITATEIFDPFHGDTVVSPGTERCPGGTLNPDALLDLSLPVCLGGGPVIKRGIVFTARVTPDSPDPRIAGVVTVVDNENHDSGTGEGSSWGTWSLDLDDSEDTWEGTWHSTRTRLDDGNLPDGCGGQSPCWLDDVRLSGHGSGSLQAQQLELRMQAYSHNLQGVGFYATLQAWIVPGAK